MISYFDPGLALSLHVPVGWRIGSNDDFALLLAEDEMLDDDYRTNVGFNTRRGNSAISREIFEGIIERTKAAQHDEYPGFAEIGERRASLSGLPAWLQQYRWAEPETGLGLTHVLALVIYDEATLLEVNGSTLTSTEQEVMPGLIDIVASVRHIPSDST